MVVSRLPQQQHLEATTKKGIESHPTLQGKSDNTKKRIAEAPPLEQEAPPTKKVAPMPSPATPATPSISVDAKDGSTAYGPSSAPQYFFGGVFNNCTININSPMTFFVSLLPDHLSLLALYHHVRAIFFVSEKIT